MDAAAAVKTALMLSIATLLAALALVGVSNTTVHAAPPKCPFGTYFNAVKGVCECPLGSYWDPGLHTCQSPDPMNPSSY